MINFESKKASFSKVYKIKIQNYNKIVKIYNRSAFSDFFREDLQKTLKFYKSLNNLKISPFHKVLSKHIIEIDEVESDFILNKKKFFKNKRLLVQFKDHIELMNGINKSLIDKKLIDEIKKYLYVINSNKIIKINIKKLENYINKYPQNRVCHGDIHFKNLIVSKHNLLLLDWDYIVISSLGYDLAMFAYLEKLNKKQKIYLSQMFKISTDEIDHYTPICELLDYLYQKVLYQLNLIKNINNSLIKRNKDFISNTL